MQSKVGKSARVGAGAGALAAVATGALLTATAGAAGSPVISSAKACYVNGTSIAPVTITGSGWTPGDSVQLSSASGDLFGTAVVGSDGTFMATISGAGLRTVKPAQMTEVLNATDEGNDTTGATATGQTARIAFQIANLAIATNPAEAKPTKKVTFTFSGFSAGTPIYAHYLHRGKVVASQRFGTATGVCGTLKSRARLYPGGRPRYENYTVQFDDSARYSKGAVPKLVSSIRLFML